MESPKPHTKLTFIEIAKICGFCDQKGEPCCIPHHNICACGEPFKTVTNLRRHIKKKMQLSTRDINVFGETLSDDYIEPMKTEERGNEIRKLRRSKTERNIRKKRKRKRVGLDDEREVKRKRVSDDFEVKRRKFSFPEYGLDSDSDDAVVSELAFKFDQTVNVSKEKSHISSYVI